MSFPRYSNYKDSGVEWLGAVPAHWPVSALAYRYEVALGKMLDAKQISGAHLRPYLRNTDVQWGRINTADLPMMDFDESDRKRFSLRPGDLLVCEGGEVGRAAVWGGQLAECYYQKALHRLRPAQSGQDDARFMFWVLQAAVAAGCFAANESKATIAHLPAEAFRRVRFPFPRVEEQRAIAEFLDRETSKIDALVAEQVRLIELLKEKRQAVISHAVTKGLAPEAPMKDSGIEWLGQVPTHWEVLPLRHAITSIDQGSSPQCENFPADDHAWGVLKVGCGNGEQFDPGEQKALPAGVEPERRSEVSRGDILMSRGNTLQLVGLATLVGDCRPRLLLSDLLYRFRARADRVDSAFLVAQLRSPLSRVQIERAAVGTSPSMKKISQGTIGALVVCLPPLVEQRRIVSLIEKPLNRFDLLIREAERAVELLLERRSAIITSAVTGQIDVRPESMRSAA